MTIECTACHARYTIADSLVPPQGARVRCRKCSAVFLVQPSAPVVTPEPLPVVPPTPEAPAHAATPPAPVEAPSQAHPPAAEPKAAPATPEPSRRSAAPETPSQPADSGFDRFPSHAPPSHPAATEFERFPAASTSVAPAPHAAAPAQALFGTPESAATEPAAGAAVFAPVPREETHVAPAPPPAQREPVHHEPAAPAHHEPAAPAHHEPAAHHETHRPRISATTLPEGLSPEELQRHERARRLARVLASDIAIYNREKRERGIRDGNLVAVLGYEIKKSWETYKERVGVDFANSTPYFRDALNEIVAEGKKIF